MIWKKQYEATESRENDGELTKPSVAKCRV